MSEIKQLNDDQLDSFDTEFVDDKRWKLIECCIDESFPDRVFTFLDVGGGNGGFADRVLQLYPKSKGAVLDNSELLLHRNKPNPNKEILLCSVDNMEEVVGERKYDIIFMNWLLHHLVSDSYEQTSKNVVELLRTSSRCLTERGVISIFENMYDGILFEDLPGHIIFALTSSKLLAPINRKMGANTAGVGVCFRSRRQWQQLIDICDLKTIHYSEGGTWDISFLQRTILHMGNVRVGHFWTRPK